MDAPLDARRVMSLPDDALTLALCWQVRAPGRRGDGAVVALDIGLADVSHGGTVPLVMGCALAAVACGRGIAGAPARRAQRPSGLVDLRSTNHDSSPDTGCAVQALCAVPGLAAPHAGDPAWQPLLAAVRQAMCRSVVGMCADGGCHASNHRWAIASALAQAAVCPGLDVAATVQAYLAEGVGIDDEALPERSIGVYDGVTDRPLLPLAERRGAPGVRGAVRCNLALDLHLLHADGTAGAGLPRRQGHGTRRVPLGLASCSLHVAALGDDPRFAAAARLLRRSAGEVGLGDLVWLGSVSLRFGDVGLGGAPLPDALVHLLPVDGAWRTRRGALSVASFRDTGHPLAMSHGAAELVGMRIGQAYSGAGRLAADVLIPVDGGMALHAHGQHGPRRPARELPLGRPLPPAARQQQPAERRLRRVPTAESSLSPHLREDGLALRDRTPDGRGGVTAQEALDVRPGGLGETDGTAAMPVTGQVILLRRGRGVMRHGDDVTNIEPGADGHRAWQMRHAGPAPDLMRTVLTLRTPADHASVLRVGSARALPASL
jgi:hypothetical protein